MGRPGYNREVGRPGYNREVGRPGNNRKVGRPGYTRELPKGFFLNLELNKTHCRQVYRQTG